MDIWLTQLHAASCVSWKSRGTHARGCNEARRARARARAQPRAHVLAAQKHASPVTKAAALSKKPRPQDRAPLRIDSNADRGPWNSKGPPISGYMCRDE